MSLAGFGARQVLLSHCDSALSSFAKSPFACVMLGSRKLKRSGVLIPAAARSAKSSTIWKVVCRHQYAGSVAVRIDNPAREWRATFS